MLFIMHLRWLAANIWLILITQIYDARSTECQKRKGVILVGRKKVRKVWLGEADIRKVVLLLLLVTIWISNALYRVIIKWYQNTLFIQIIYIFTYNQSQLLHASIFLSITFRE